MLHNFFSHKSALKTPRFFILPVHQIRGHCDVTLLSSVDKFNEDYLETDTTHFYTLVYDQNQRTVVTDRGDIRVGNAYQAEIPETMTDLQRKNKLDNRRPELLEKLVFDGANLKCEEEETGHENGQATEAKEEENMNGEAEENAKAKTEAKMDDKTGSKQVTEDDLDRLITIAKSVGLYARALDASAASVQPLLQVSACMASRDSTLQWAMDCMHNSGYDLGEAVKKMVTKKGPVLVRDQLEAWSPSEAQLFEDGVDRYGKEFSLIRAECLPWKSYSAIIEFYYMWKASDRYLSYKRTKAVEQEKKMRQFQLPNSHKEDKNSSAMLPENSMSCNRACEGCCTLDSDVWYTWGPPNLHCRLCSACWQYWKKYGGLKMSQSQRVELMQQQQKKVPGTNDEKKTALRMSTQLNSVEQQRKQKEIEIKKQQNQAAKSTEGENNAAENTAMDDGEQPAKKIKTEDEMA